MLSYDTSMSMVVMYELQYLVGTGVERREWLLMECSEECVKINLQLLEVLYLQLLLKQIKAYLTCAYILFHNV